MTTGTPAAEVEIDADLVCALLREQHPDLAALELAPIDSGWDNEMFRLGADFVVRLPRRLEAVSLIEHEQRVLPQLADHLPIAIPAPLFIGRPSTAFPWPWSVLPWLPGVTADVEAPAADQAAPFAHFLRALHRAAPADAPNNQVRGVPLRVRADPTEVRLARLGDRIGPRIWKLWQDALNASPADQSCWLHGDLHARNVLVERGVISGIIDWGDVTGGDVATDLASVWSLFDDASARADCLAVYDPPDALATRARGWAVLFGAVLLDTGLVDHPRHAAMGEAVLRRLDEGE